MPKNFTRREFLATSAVTAAAGIAATPNLIARDASLPALLGGKPTRTEPFPAWPQFDASEEQALISTLKSGQWFRGNGKNVAAFEAAFADLMGAKRCIGTSSGTTALISSLNALGVGAGDEVILPPYTFVACVNAILMVGAVPVFVDSDLETFQIDASKIENAITERTTAIMPVHLGGNAANLDLILNVAQKHKIPVLEDACQAHMGEWRGKKLGTHGTLGCFSFQASKNLTAGEGGAILTQDEQLAEQCFAAMSNSRPKKRSTVVRAANFRMSEFHAGILLSQMQRLPDQSKRRDANAAYLATLLREIPGIIPAKLHEGCTRSGHHLYMFRYQPEAFARLPRARFLSALAAEGIRASSGYAPLNKEPFISETLQSRGFKRVVSKERLEEWSARNDCPVNDRLCQEAVWFTQNVLLDKREAMDQIADAIRKIQKHAPELLKS